MFLCHLNSSQPDHGTAHAPARARPRKLSWGRRAFCRECGPHVSSTGISHCRQTSGNCEELGHLTRPSHVLRSRFMKRAASTFASLAWLVSIGASSALPAPSTQHSPFVPCHNRNCRYCKHLSRRLSCVYFFRFFTREMPACSAKCAARGSSGKVLMSSSLWPF